MSAWSTVVGLEVHVQLATQTKIFCGCRNAFGEPPNTLICPVCTGQPGALPVLGAEALRLAVRAALAVGAEVAPVSKFDRKNYFYPDLPKGYQISQYDRPFCQGGAIELANGRRVRFVRLHLEEDAGKAVHQGGATLVDLNRAGVPLVESVTEPDMTSADEAHEFLTRFKERMRWIGVSDCDMEKGSLRCDVNISVRRAGEPLRAKVELKNLNSFRFVKDAIEVEAARQIATYEAGGEVHQETRLWDPDARETRVMRSKEDALDYRYFPEPDLPPVAVDGAFVERERHALPELPDARRARYVEELGLSEYDAGVLCGERAVADWFEMAARLSGRPKETANWVSNGVLRALGDDDVEAGSIDELAIKPQDVADLIAAIDAGRINKTSARDVLRHMIAKDRGVRDAIEDLGLKAVDASELEAWCREALVGRDEVVRDVQAGKQKAIGALIGPVMQKSRGQADAQAVRATLLRLIEEL